MKQNKFIISTNGELRLGYVEYHKHLLKKNEYYCNGGGKFFIDNLSKTVKLWDCSGDFGFPKFHKLRTVPEYYDAETKEFIDLSDYTLIYEDLLGEVTFEKKVSEL